MTKQLNDPLMVQLKEDQLNVDQTKVDQLKVDQLKNIITDSKIGICIKKKDHTVIHQNSDCIDICGIQYGKVCNFGCMGLLEKMNSDTLNSRSIELLQRSKVKDQLCDIAIINDGDHLFTLLLDIKNRVEVDYHLFEEYGLTSRELEVVKLRLEGRSNAEISEQLFVAKSTLKTHLNHIYQKLPSNLKLWNKK